MGIGGIECMAHWGGDGRSLTYYSVVQGLQFGVENWDSCSWCGSSRSTERDMLPDLPAVPLCCTASDVKFLDVQVRSVANSSDHIRTHTSKMSSAV